MKIVISIECFVQLSLIIINIVVGCRSGFDETLIKQIVQ